MKIIKTVSLILILFFSKNTAVCQTLNWANLQHQRHIVNMNAGFDYGITYGVGYGHHLKTKLPVVLNIEHSQPAGENVFDDFKTKIGVQIRLYQIHNFHFAAKAQGIFRRFENSYVRLLNFGSDVSATAGYYKPKWFVAGEFGFDKAIVTHFKHSDLFGENFSNAKDGWYEPATGGNFSYGIQTGYSFGSNDLTVKAGKVIQEDFKTSPTIPFYFQVGYNRRF